MCESLTLLLLFLYPSHFTATYQILSGLTLGLREWLSISNVNAVRKSILLLSLNSGRDRAGAHDQIPKIKKKFDGALRRPQKNSHCFLRLLGILKTMETLGVISDAEMSCFRGIFASEEHDYSPQFLGQSSLLLGEHDRMLIGIESAFCSAPEAGENEFMFNSLDALNPDLQFISQESSFSSSCNGDAFFVANPGHMNYYLSDPNQALANEACMFMNVCMMHEKVTGSFIPSPGNVLVDETVGFNEDKRGDKWENSNQSQPELADFAAEQMHLKRKFDVPELEASAEDKINISSSENQKKKPRVSRDVQKSTKNAQLKKNQKVAGSGYGAEKFETRLHGQGCSSYSLEDDNASQENSGGASSESKPLETHNTNVKNRPSRGSATDPQSLYARKRRERINERLRILQNLVPNGTKVDISTMLEEAVHYVKFLQLQIKLLSSDDLWMYAPIAYNGVDIGLNLSRKISPAT